MMRMMSEAEMKIAEWVWANPGIGSMQLVKLCESNYAWKKSTVFTLIKRMRDKEMLENRDSRLYMKVERGRYYHDWAKSFIETNYQGSLAQFLESYFAHDGISRLDAGRLLNIIRRYTN